MSLTPVTYLPLNSGLGDTAPAAAAKINAGLAETDTALANAAAALAAAGTAQTQAATALAAANGVAAQAATALSTANTASTTATTANTNVTAALTAATTAQTAANTANSNASSAVNTAAVANTAAAAATSNVTALTTTVNGYSASITTATNNASSALTTANAASSTANALSAQVTTANNTANAASTSVTTLTTTVNNQAASITAATNTANTANTNANAATSNVGSLTTTVNGYSASITTATNNAATALTAANTATSNVATLTTTVNGQAASITTANTNASAALTTANTANTSVTSLSSTVAGLGGAQKLITASAFAGVDPTGATSSLTAWNNMITQASANFAAGTPTTIIIDCPIFLSIGQNGANTLFHPPNVNVQGTPDGMIITDQMGAPLYFFCNVSNITWKNVHVQYRQPLNGSYMSNQNVPNSYVSVAGAFQSSYLGGSGGYLSQTNNVKYASGGSPIWGGPSALTALFNMRGNCTNITFDGCTFDVPQNASPAGFIYTFMQYAQEWVPNNVIIGQRSFTTASWNSGTGLVTVNVGSAVLGSPFVIGNQYWFYVSSSANPGYANSNLLVTIASTSTFTYPLATNPGTFSGTGYYASQTIAGVTAATPTNITWSNCIFDGVIMGHVGTAQANFLNCRWIRYSDLQDGTNSVVTFAGSGPTNGATTATLASPWTYPTSQYWVTLGNSQMIGMNMTLGSTTCNTFQDPIAGTATSVVGTMVATAIPANGATSMTLTGWTLGVVAAFNGMQVKFTNSTNDVRTVTVTTVSPYTTFTATFAALSSVCTSATQTLLVGTAASSGNVGGVPGVGSHGYVLYAGPYSPPPHAIYMGSSSGSYPAWVVVKNCLDLGVRVYNTPTSRSLENSGNALSLKCELGRGTIIDGWTSYRPDGGADLQSFGGTQGSTVSNCTFYFNSNTPLTDWLNNVGSYLPGSNASGGSALQGVQVFGVRMPGPNSYNNIALNNIVVYDTNPSPLQMPFLGTTFAPNQNISATGIKCYLNDWGPPGAANAAQPTIQMGGTNITLDAEVYYDSFSTTSSYIGTINSVVSQNANIYIKHYGYRTPAITLSGAITAATSATLAASTSPPTPGCYGTWPFPSATYKVIFADNSVRYCAFTNGSATFTWTGQATVTASTSQLTGITAQGMYYSNFGQYKPRLVLPTTSGQTAGRYRMDDYSNNYFQDALDNAISETFSDSQNCIPVAGSSTFTTAMTIFSYFSLTQLNIGTSAALGTTGGLTGYTVGYSGALAAFGTFTSVGKYAQNTAYNPSTLASIASAATGSNRTILITATGGTFDGTGSIQIAFRAVGTSMGS